MPGVNYKIASSQPFGRALKRVAAGQVRRALRSLKAVSRASKPTGGRVAGAVHEARSRFKKVRGLLRLARSGLGRKAFKQEDRFFSHAGRQIRTVRDAVALVEALDALSRLSFKGKLPPIVTQLRQLLARDAQMASRAAASRAAIARVARLLDDELDRIEAWNLTQFTWKDAHRARRRAARTCREAFETAVADPTDDNLHQWRKRVKNLWHVLLLMRERCPDLQELAAQLASLARILGEDHDLAMLALAASARKHDLRSPSGLKLLLATLSARRKELQTGAFAMSATILPCLRP